MDARLLSEGRTAHPSVAARSRAYLPGICVVTWLTTLLVMWAVLTTPGHASVLESVGDTSLWTTPQAQSSSGGGWQPEQAQRASSGRVWKMVSAAVGVVALITVIAIVVLVVKRRRETAPLSGDSKLEPSAVGSVRPDALLRDATGITGRPEIELTEDVVVFGRSKQNTVPGVQGVILPLKTVGRRHARIEFHDGFFWISDLGSVNGTIVNGVRIHSPAALNNGDVFCIESVELTFILPAHNQAEATQMTGREGDADVTNLMLGTSEPPDGQSGGMTAGLVDDEEYVEPDATEVPVSITVAPGFEASHEKDAAKHQHQEGGLIASYLDEDEWSSPPPTVSNDDPTAVAPGVIHGAASEAREGGLYSNYLDNDGVADPQFNVASSVLSDAEGEDIASYYEDSDEEYVPNSNTSLLNDEDFALAEDEAGVTPSGVDDLHSEQATSDRVAEDWATAFAPGVPTAATQVGDEPTAIFREEELFGMGEAAELAQEFDLSAGSSTGEVSAEDIEAAAAAADSTVDFELLADAEPEAVDEVDQADVDKWVPPTRDDGEEVPATGAAPLADLEAEPEPEAAVAPSFVVSEDNEEHDEDAAIASFMDDAFGGLSGEPDTKDETLSDVAPQVLSADDDAPLENSRGDTEDSMPMMPEAPAVIAAADADAIRDVIAPGAVPGMRANVPADLEVTSESTRQELPEAASAEPVAPAAPAMPLQPEMERSPPAAPTMPAASAMPPVQQQPAAAVDLPEAYLIDLDGSTNSQRFQIMTDNLSVGRSTPTRMTSREYLSIRRNTIGRRHASVRYARGRFWVEDHRSVNGTFVNGERVMGTAPLESGDELMFDTFRFNFVVIPADHVGGGDDDPRLDVDQTQFRGA